MQQNLMQQPTEEDDTTLVESKAQLVEYLEAGCKAMLVEAQNCD